MKSDLIRGWEGRDNLRVNPTHTRDSKQLGFLQIAHILCVSVTKHQRATTFYQEKGTFLTHDFRGFCPGSALFLSDLPQQWEHVEGKGTRLMGRKKQRKRKEGTGSQWPPQGQSMR